MRLGNPFTNGIIGDLFETALPDFVLAFTFFTSVVYAVLGKRFELQRPAIAMSASIGFALSVGLVWWEQSTGFSIRDLGPIAVGFAVILLAYVLYLSIKQVGGSWAGAGIAIGASLIVGKLLELRLPVDSEIIQSVMTVTLIVGVLAFFAHHQQRYPQLSQSRSNIADVRHDMSDLYRGKRLSKRLTKGLHRIRHETKELDEHPEQTGNIMAQLKKMLPAEGFLTKKMAQLRAKAHRIRNGHIARLQETRQVFAKLPTPVKKKAAADLASRYRQIIGIDTRLERLEKSVAENEQRVRQLTSQAQMYTSKNDRRKLHDTLKAAEKLQHHNSRLVKIIQRQESKLSAIAKKVAQEVSKIET